MPFINPFSEETRSEFERMRQTVEKFPTPLRQIIKFLVPQTPEESLIGSVMGLTSQFSSTPPPPKPPKPPISQDVLDDLIRDVDRSIDVVSRQFRLGQQGPQPVFTEKGFIGTTADPKFARYVALQDTLRSIPEDNKTGRQIVRQLLDAQERLIKRSGARRIPVDQQPFGNPLETILGRQELRNTLLRMEKPIRPFTLIKKPSHLLKLIDVFSRSLRFSIHGVQENPTGGPEFLLLNDEATRSTYALPFSDVQQFSKLSHRTLFKTVSQFVKKRRAAFLDTPGMLKNFVEVLGLDETQKVIKASGKPTEEKNRLMKEALFLAIRSTYRPLFASSLPPPPPGSEILRLFELGTQQK